MTIMRTLSFLLAALSLVSCVVVVGCILYSTLDAFAPIGGFISFDFRLVTILVSSAVTAIIAGVGLLFSGVGLVASLRLETGPSRWVWWVAHGLLFSTELLANVVLFLVTPELF